VTVLVTGAAGGVARRLLPYLADLPVRRTDLVAADDGTIVGDLTDPAFADTVTAGVDAIVHLAATPDSGARWDQLTEPNLTAVARLLAAAATHRVPRIVLASSVHAMGEYVHAGRLPVDESWVPAPCCPYGATKAFAEAAGRAHAYRTGASVVCLRLGAVQPEPFTVGMRPVWLGPDDLGQLVRRALSADVTFGAYHGVSAGSASWSTALGAAELGYVPTLDPRDHPVGDDTATSLCAPEA
jgi:uronate dehydrogenase